MKSNNSKPTRQHLEPTPLISVKKFAELASISEREAYRKVRDREIEYVQVGAKKIGIPVSAYERFVAERTKPALKVDLDEYMRSYRVG